VFEQYAHILKSEVPHLNIEGDTYPPPRINEILSNVMFGVRMGLLLLILAGPDALRNIGIENPPGIYMWTQDNKVQFNLRIASFPGPLSISQLIYCMLLRGPGDEVNLIVRIVILVNVLC
jgi:hypothetical protein